MNKKWSKEAVLAEASKYRSKIEWKKNSASSYKKARISGWLAEASVHMDTLWEPKWDKKTIIEEAKKYQTRKEWAQKSASSYGAASKLGILKEATSHMRWISHKNKWNEQTVREEILKYSSIAEWSANSPGSYEAAKRLKISWEGERLWVPKWTKEMVLKDALKYQNISAWIVKSSGAYKAAVKLKIMDQACAHMKVLGGRSTMENELMSILKKRFPKAHRISMANKDPDFVAKRFHLDVYVPELRKGVEFDGEYWHSTKGLKRGRPNWTDEQIENYHDLKDGFFKSRNIDVIHIREREWVENKEKCIEQVCKFLNIGE